MFKCPVVAVVPAESVKLSNLYIDAKHIESLLTHMFNTNTIKLAST